MISGAVLSEKHLMESLVILKNLIRYGSSIISPLSKNSPLARNGYFSVYHKLEKYGITKLLRFGEYPVNFCVKQSGNKKLRKNVGKLLRNAVYLFLHQM